MPKVLDLEILPLRHRNDKWVLQEITTYDAWIPGWRRIHKQRKRLWPEAKLINGRGIEFETRKKAMEFYLEHRVDASAEGHSTKMLLQRLEVG